MKIRVLKLENYKASAYKLQRKILGVWFDCDFDGGLCFSDAPTCRFLNDALEAKQRLQKPKEKPKWVVVDNNN